MATDSTNPTIIEEPIEADSEELSPETVQLAQSAAISIEFPIGQFAVTVPVQAGQTIQLPFADEAMRAELNHDGDLVVSVGNRVITLDGYAEVADQVQLIGVNGEVIDTATLIAATDSSLEVQPAAGAAAGAQGNAAPVGGNGIFSPFGPGQGLGGLTAIGVLGGTERGYGTIDDDQTFVPLGEESETPPSPQSDAPGGTIDGSPGTNVPPGDDVGFVSGSFSGGFEDWLPNEHLGNTTQSPMQLFIDFDPADNEQIQQLMIEGIPSDATVYVGGTDSANVVSVVGGKLVIAANPDGSLPEIFLLPGGDRDNDFTLHVSLKIIDPDSGLTTTVSANVPVTIDAVADKPSIVAGGLCNDDGNQPQTGPEPEFCDFICTGDNGSAIIRINASFGDSDGSETHTVEFRVPEGWALDATSLSAGWAVETRPTGQFAVFMAPDGGHADIIDTEVTLNPIGGPSTIGATITVTAIAVEDPSDGELSAINNRSVSTAVVQINATPTITFADGDGTTIVSDEGLAGGNKDGTGVPQDDTNSAGDSGSFTISDADAGQALTVEILTIDLPNDWTSGGKTIEWKVEGNTLTGYVDGDPLNAVLTLELSGNGSNWSYQTTLLKQLDHPDPNVEDERVLNVTIKVTDDCEASATAVLTVQVEDDSPAQSGAVISATVEEDDLDNAQSVGNNEDGSVGATIASGSVAGVVTVGADEPTSFSLGSDFSGLVAQGLTSGGVALSYAVNGDTLTASANGLTVFTLQVNADGTYTFTLVDQLDHPTGNGENNLIIDLSTVISATDFDGDTVTVDAGSFQITVQDDVPVQTQNVVSGTVEEDDLDNANSTGNNEDGSVGATIATGSVAGVVTVGADEPASFSLGTDFSGLVAQGLTSGGVALGYSVNGDTLTASANDLTVFTLQVNADGTYTFTLVDQLDHPAANGENNLVIDLSSMISASDFDGDTITVGAGSFQVTVEDDVPVLDQGTVSATAEEDDLSNAQSTGNNEDGSSGKGVATGSLSSLVSVGADEEGTFSLLGDTSGLPALNSKGEAVNYAVNGNTLTATAGGRTVFTLTVTADGAFTFTLVDQLDHDAGNGENSLDIDFSSIIAFIDADGDLVLLDDSFQVTVEDDVPVQTQNVVSGAVDEDELPDGNTDGDAVTTIASGNMAGAFTVGADEPATYALSSDFSGLAGQNLKSNGVALSYSIVAGELVATASGNDVFKLSIDAATGAYTFTLLSPLDHANADGDDNETLSIDLSSAISVTDFDGDQLAADAGSFVITVEDDVPEDISPLAAEVTNAPGSTDTKDLDFQDNVGADRSGSVVFDVNGVDGSLLMGSIDGGPLEALSSDGNPIYLFGWGTGQLTATTDPTNSDVSQAIFTVTLDPGADTYTIEMFGTINDGSGISFDKFPTGGAGLREWLGITDPTPGDPDQDLLITPTVPGIDTVNNDSNDIGVNNQFVDPTNGVDPAEAIRLDFVSGLNVNASFKDVANISYLEHYLVNDVGSTIIQIQGGGKGVDMLFKAYDADDDLLLTGDAGDVQDTISSFRVLDENGIDVSDLFTDASKANYNVIFNPDGSLQVEDLQEGWKVYVSTDSGFNRLEIFNAEDAGNDAFALGEFDVGAVLFGDPVQMDFGLTVKDQDGDPSAGTITMNLLPDDPIV